MEFVRLGWDEPAPADLFDHLGDESDDEPGFAADRDEGFVESEE